MMNKTNIIVRRMSSDTFTFLILAAVVLPIFAEMKIGIHTSAGLIRVICFALVIVCCIYLIPFIQFTETEIISRNLFFKRKYYNREDIINATFYKYKKYMEIEFRNSQKLTVWIDKYSQKVILYIWASGVKCKSEDNRYIVASCKLELKESTNEKALEFAKQATEVLKDKLKDIKSEYAAAGIDLEIGLINKNEIHYGYQKWKWYQAKQQGYAISIRLKKDGKYFKNIVYPCFEVRINLVLRNIKGQMKCIINYERCFDKYWKYELINLLEEIKISTKFPETIEGKSLDIFIQ